MKKSSTPIKKKSGPNTAKGKLVSSQNAIKTGVTAKQLLNEQEFNRFSQLKDDLNRHYSDSNPLIPLQIEKIARLQIQLERIQNAIDASYRASEQSLDSAPSKKKAGESNLQLLRTELKIRMQLIDAGLLDQIKGEFFSKIYADLIHENSLSQDEDEWTEGPQFISCETLLGGYLWAEAQSFRQHPKDYIEEKLKAIANARGRKSMYEDIDLELLTKAIDIKNSKPKDLSIEVEGYYERKQLESWFEIEMSKVPDYIHQIQSSIKQKNNELRVAMPNYDDLDRLMRYQTSLSRQLSTAIGELMILAKQ